MASGLDIIIRLIGDSGQFREDMRQDKVALDDLLNSVHDAAVDIDLDDAEAEAKLDDFKAKLDALRNVTEKIKLDDTVAKAEVDEFAQKLRDLTNAAVKIKLDDTDAKAQLDEFVTKFDELRNDAASVKIKVDDALAKADIAEFKDEMDTLNNNTVHIKADTEQAKAELEEIKLKEDELNNQTIHIRVEQEGNIRRLGQDITNADNAAKSAAGSGGGFNLLSLALAAGHGLVPLAATLLGDLMGLAGAFAAAGAGAAGFALVAVPNLTQVFGAVSDGKANVKGLDDAQASAAKSLATLEQNYSSLAKSFEQPVLTAFTYALQAADNIMQDMRPVIQSAATAIDGLMQSFAQWSGGSQAKQFFDWLGQQAGPAIQSFGETFGNIFKGVMSLLEDFTPMIKPVEQGMVGMSQSFANWAAGLNKTQGFKDFLTYIQTNAPKAGDLIKNLADIAGRLLQGFAPIGSVLLNVADALSKVIAYVMNANGEIPQMVAAGLQFIGILRMMPAALGPYGVAIAAIVEGAILIVTHWQNVVANAKLMWTTITSVWQGAATWFTNLFKSIEQSFTTGWQQIKQYGQNGAKSAYDGVTGVWNAITKWFDDLYQDVDTSFTTGWAQLQQDGQSLAQSAYDGVTSVWKAITGWFDNLWSSVAGVVSKGWTAIKEWLSSNIPTVISQITQPFSSLSNFFGTLANQALQWGANLVHMIANGIRSAIGDVESAASSVAKAISSFLGFHSPTEEGPASDSDTWAPNFINMFTEGLQAGIPKVQAALNQVMVPPNIASMVTSAGSKLGSAVATTLHVSYQQNAPVYGVDDLHGLIGSAVQSGISNFVGQVQVAARASGIRT
ncbi:phage tail protein [Alicyclobacillus acidoterrestris]|uniref:phage tail protein n=1 Tax=Alicyclobacillus acidoterrestris TaxID=1450 RepID=UPI003F533341